MKCLAKMLPNCSRDVSEMYLPIVFQLCPRYWYCGGKSIKKARKPWSSLQLIAYFSECPKMWWQRGGAVLLMDPTGREGWFIGGYLHPGKVIERIPIIWSKEIKHLFKIVLGATDYPRGREVLRLNCEREWCQWRPRESAMNLTRSNFVAIRIPEEMAICETPNYWVNPWFPNKGGSFSAYSVLILLATFFAVFSK